VGLKKRQRAAPTTPTTEGRTAARRLLVICNGHPGLRPGGAELAAYQLFAALRSRQGWRPFFFAPTEAPPLRTGRLESFGGAHDELLWHTDGYDSFLFSQSDMLSVVQHVSRILDAFEPDVVHVHHTDRLGLDVLPVIRRARPRVPIVYTLHEFLPICHALGKMVRPRTGELCDRASAQRCNACFPDIPADDFVRRERLVKARLAHVDVFLCPSHFLLNRYREWGLPEDRLVFQENGCGHTSGAEALVSKPPIGNFGFFGQLLESKGLEPLMKAVKHLQDSGFEGFHLSVSGSNLQFSGKEFRKRFVAWTQDNADRVSLLGQYAQEELEKRMRSVAWVVAPSVWWENSPLVIQEAFAYKRPVICSDIGGMAEKVSHEGNGLHFRVGDSFHLAEAMRRAATESGLWDRLQQGIGPVVSLDESVEAHVELYERLLNRGRGAELKAQGACP
jgi:glycosyltransferase involved in cell wall biosynthesis